MKLNLTFGVTRVTFYFVAHWAAAVDPGSPVSGAWKYTNSTFLPKGLIEPYNEATGEMKATNGVEGFSDFSEAEKWADDFSHNNPDRVFRVCSCTCEYEIHPTYEVQEQNSSRTAFYFPKK